MYICFINFNFDIHRKEVALITDSQDKAKKFCDEYDTKVANGDTLKWASYRVYTPETALTEQEIHKGKDDYKDISSI